MKLPPQNPQPKILQPRNPRPRIRRRRLRRHPKPCSGGSRPGCRSKIQRQRPSPFSLFRMPRPKLNKMLRHKPARMSGRRVGSRKSIDKPRPSAVRGRRCASKTSVDRSRVRQMHVPRVRPYRMPGRRSPQPDRILRRRRSCRPSSANATRLRTRRPRVLVSCRAACVRLAIAAGPCQEQIQIITTVIGKAVTNAPPIISTRNWRKSVQATDARPP